MVEASLVNYAETIGILVGVVIALIQLRNIGRTRETELETRQAQLFLELVGRIHNKEFVDQFFEILGWEWDDFNEFWEKYGREKNPQSFSMFLRIQNIIESLGFYTKLELVDPSLTDELMSIWLIKWWWEKHALIFTGMRNRYDSPRLAEWTEYLYSEIQHRAQKRGYP